MAELWTRDATTVYEGTLGELMLDNGELVFDVAQHRYYIGAQELPSVTTCLKNARIVDYSMIPADVLRKAAERGTLVHRIVEFELTGGVDEASIDPQLWGYVVAARKFLADSGFTVEQVECRVFDKQYGYAGTFDLRGKLRNGDRSIVDWKTGILLPGHCVQMAGYAHGTGEPLRDRRLLVQLRSDGEYRVHEAMKADYAAEFAAFAGAVAAMRWLMEKAPKRARLEAA